MCGWSILYLSSRMFLLRRDWLLLLDPPVKVVNEEVSAACEMATFKPWCADVKNITNGISGNCFQYELLSHIVSEKTPDVKQSPCEPEAGTALKKILSLLCSLSSSSSFFFFCSRPSLEVKRFYQYFISYFAGGFSKVSQSIRAEYVAQGQGIPQGSVLSPLRFSQEVQF